MERVKSLLLIYFTSIFNKNIISTTKDSIEIIKKSSISKLVNDLKKLSKEGKLSESIIVEEIIEILKSFSGKRELGAAAAIVYICSIMSAQELFSIRKALSSIVRFNVIKDIFSD